MHIKVFSFLEWLTAAAGIITISPYFIWTTYRNDIWNGKRIGTMPLILMITGIFILMVLLKVGTLIPKKVLLISFILILIFAISVPISGNGFTIFPSMIMIYLIIAIFLMIPDIHKYNIFEKFRFLFAVFLIPSIIYWILLTLGVNIPSARIEPMQQGYLANGYYYIWYPLSVFSEVGSGFPRFCGIYNEPGVVGTTGALLLVASKMRLKKDWENMVLLIAGILSLSLAFYLTIAVYLFLSIMRKGTGWGITVTIAGLISYIIFMSINFDASTPISKELNIVQSRLQIKDGKLAGDNRTSHDFEVIYNNFVEQGGKRFLFGNGYATSQELGVDVSSYQNLIYDYGIVGFLLLMGWIIISYSKLNIRKINSASMVLLIIFLINIYQRPYVFQFYYMIILFGGGAYLTIIEQDCVQ